jgi:hypothetical protein
MNNQDYATSFIVDKTPQEVYDAILNIPAWWSGDVKGTSDKVDNEFTYEVSNTHWSKQKVTELVPGKRVVWRVVDSRISYTKPENVWDNTEIIFDIVEKSGKTELHFSQHGMVPSLACYGDISSAWDALVPGNLKQLIETGKDQPSPW